ncbi:amino acid ABC transporter permease [Caldilinea sp.]|jgi:polar amino acid transport system permease protein|uniref:amino acid ABC transporter permease n=1 Tax=Caldilinea sp. TaxID=2293560 RepID=UPI001B14C547|nr:amino acid ABC transporter permease [Caldilinea sp.]MBO9394509.1 amino acid ABC transporter permease [Caldilinea sp.]
MTAQAGEDVASRSGYDLTRKQDQEAFAAHLLAQERRRRTLQRIRVFAVWIALFAILWFVFSFLNIDFGYTVSNAEFVLLGIGVTLGVSLVSIAIASIIALFGALGRLSTNAFFHGLSTFYVSIFRGTPLLVQIFIIYLGLPQIGQQIAARGYPWLGALFILTAIQSGVLALSLNYGAYMTEIFRAGIQSVSYGQWQAAAALGMSRWQTLRLIVLPQAIKVIIPAVGNQFIAMQKDSSLVSVMGVWEITYRANRFARRDSKYMEMFLLAAAIYWVLTIVSEWLLARLEGRMARSDRR